MKNKRIIAVFSTIIILVGVFAACSQSTEIVNDTTISVVTNVEEKPSEPTVSKTKPELDSSIADTTTSETNPVRKEITGTTVKKTTTHKATTTTKKTTTSQKEHTSQKQTTAKQTTQKQTTTKKQSTTQKQTTTKPKTTKSPTTKKKETTSKKKETTKSSTCTGNSNHSQACGNMGKWFKSQSEVKAYVNKEMKYWADLEERGEITREEYYKKCPSGYECWSCGYCGKWTGNFKY